ncbi:MAG: hypothetical protein NT066_04560, partial [Candidatus Omnitrophica bacterium]|nr:hypothetical protein [Candidatus Omnitrophota bacterium]
MEKRLVLAIALSLLVLLSWSALAPKPQQLENKEVITPTPSSGAVIPKQPPFLTIEKELPVGALFEYGQDKFSITFLESLAAIKEIRFKAHQDYKFSLQYGFSLADNTLSFQKASSSADVATFV